MNRIHFGSTTGWPCGRRAVTIVEVAVGTVCVVLIVGVLSGAAMMMRGGNGEAVSYANLAAIHQAHVNYAQANGGKQWSAHLDNFGITGGNCASYLATMPCPPQQILGLSANGGLWGYWLGGGNCSSFPGSCGNWQAYIPNTFTAQLSGWFGASETLNVRSFHNYLNGRFYDPVYYAPNDIAAYNTASVHFNSTAEYVPFPNTQQVVWSSYMMSAASMWGPSVLRAQADGGFQNPNTVADGYTVQPLAGAAFPELKSLTFEKRWNQSPPSSGLSYNAGINSRPVTLFYDGHVAEIVNSLAIIDDARIVQQGGNELWCRSTPLGAAGYGGAAVGSRTSHSTLTTNGILGRDVTSTSCNVGGPQLTELLSGWGTDSPADLNGDDIVDGIDLTALFSGWGDCP